ncbi:hypothetical protein ACOSQ2_020486 [Xanthoceras sorbifolium]
MDSYETAFINLALELRLQNKHQHLAQPNNQSHRFSHTRTATTNTTFTLAFFCFGVPPRLLEIVGATPRLPLVSPPSPLGLVPTYGRVGFIVILVETMVYCNSCAREVAGHRPLDAQLCCDFCGRVIDSYNFATDVQFTKDGAGQSRMDGRFVNSIQSEYGSSQERLRRALMDLGYLKDSLDIDHSDEVLKVAEGFYKIAFSKGFTRGRKTEQVQASCLYLACREKDKPFLLIDFSYYLNINVYELGAVYLQLCQVLYLADQPFRKLVDPSIFLHKFSVSLWPEENKKICRTARDILASMKRDWMTTGRKPSGLCGAALYISALTHGVKISKSKIIEKVHMCEATLTKRLVEFETTDSGSLTIEDFMKTKELQESSSTKHQNSTAMVSGTDAVLCEHKNNGKPFAYGLCKSCYDEFMTISGGIEGGSDPPAFQAAERERIVKESAEENATVEKELNSPFVSGDGKVQFPESDSIEAGIEQADANENGYDQSAGDDASTEASDKSEHFSDIDDTEIDGYLHNEEEKHYKKIIWEQMNREYLQEQAEKEAVAAAAKEAFEANYKNCPDDLKAAQELHAAVSKARKERRQKQAADARSSDPAQTALEATRQMLNKKRLGSKINYDALKELFDDSVAPDQNPKRRFTESHSEDVENQEQLLESEDTLKDDAVLGPEDHYDDGDDDQGDDHVPYYLNQMDLENDDEINNYDDNYDYDEY